MPGYSATPLVQKLGIRPGHRVAIHDAPAGFARELEPWPPGAVIAPPGQGPLDVVMLFSGWAAGLAEDVQRAAAALTPAGMLWIAWPKRAAKVPTDLTEDRVRAIGLAGGLVDVKVCAITDVWAGLKFVRRLKDRATPPPA